MAKKKSDEAKGQVLDAPATMKPEIVAFTIVGVSPLLQNNPENFIGAVADVGLASKKVYVDADEAKLRVYQNSDGQFCHPSDAFKRSMVKAVAGKKFGKAHATAVIKGAVFIVEQYSVIEDPKGEPAKKYTIDKRSCVVNKARVNRCRPCWANWQIKVALEIDTAIVSPEDVKVALQLAGRIIGIGDFRPEKGGGFGRFKVL